MFLKIFVILILRNTRLICIKFSEFIKPNKHFCILLIVWKRYVKYMFVLLKIILDLSRYDI